MNPMNRRKFLATSAIAVTATGLLAIEGCSPSTVVNEINVVLTEAASILTTVDPGAVWVVDFQAAVTALQTAEKAWQGGSTVQIVIDALNTLVAVTAAIPVTAPYSGLVDVFVAAIEVILASLPTSTPSVGAKSQRLNHVNPRIGRVTIQHHLFHSRASDFKRAWNAEVDKNPSLSSATIR